MRWMKTALPALCAAAWAVSPAFADPAKTNEWEHSLALGVTATSGNTETELYTASWLSEFRTLSGNIARLAADAQNGENDGEKNVDNVKAVQNYKQMMNGYYLVGDVEELYDSVADISYRVTPSLGLGYYLLNTGVQKLCIDLGPGYRWEKIGGISDDYAIARASERYQRRLGETSTCWQSVEYTPKVQDFDVYTVSGEIGAEAVMTRKMSLRLVFKDQYINIPADGHKRNDSQVVGALVFKI